MGDVRKFQADLHNRLVGEIVASIVKPPLETGGTHIDVLVLFESVAVGVILAVTRLGGDEPVLDAVVERIKRRLAHQRLGPMPPQGSA